MSEPFFHTQLNDFVHNRHTQRPSVMKSGPGKSGKCAKWDTQKVKLSDSTQLGHLNDTAETTTVRSPVLYETRPQQRKRRIWYSRRTSPHSHFFNCFFTVLWKIAFSILAFLGSLTPFFSHRVPIFAYTLLLPTVTAVSMSGNQSFNATLPVCPSQLVITCPESDIVARYIEEPSMVEVSYPKPSETRCYHVTSLMVVNCASFPLATTPVPVWVTWVCCPNKCLVRECPFLDRLICLSPHVTQTIPHWRCVPIMHRTEMFAFKGDVTRLAFTGISGICFQEVFDYPSSTGILGIICYHGVTQSCDYPASFRDQLFSVCTRQGKVQPSSSSPLPSQQALGICCQCCQHDMPQQPSIVWWCWLSVGKYMEASNNPSGTSQPLSTQPNSSQRSFAQPDTSDSSLLSFFGVALLYSVIALIVCCTVAVRHPCDTSEHPLLIPRPAHSPLLRELFKHESTQTHPLLLDDTPTPTLPTFDNPTSPLEATPCKDGHPKTRFIAPGLEQTREGAVVHEEGVASMDLCMFPTPGELVVTGHKPVKRVVNSQIVLPEEIKHYFDQWRLNSQESSSVASVSSVDSTAVKISANGHKAISLVSKLAMHKTTAAIGVCSPNPASHTLPVGPPMTVQDVVEAETGVKVFHESGIMMNGCLIEQDCTSDKICVCPSPPMTNNDAASPAARQQPSHQLADVVKPFSGMAGASES